MEHKIENFNDIKSFVLAGNAVFTIRSKKSGDHVTFRVRKPKEDTPFFVSVLTGGDNESDFRYLGTVFENKDGIKYVHGKKSGIGKNAKSNKVISWFINGLKSANSKVNEQCEVYHEGRCGRCGRRLTVPESILDGLGPECKKKASMI